jgi:hypothetical protein
MAALSDEMNILRLFDSLLADPSPRPEFHQGLINLRARFLDHLHALQSGTFPGLVFPYPPVYPSEKYIKMNFYFRKLLESRTPEIYSTGYKIVSDLDDLQDNFGSYPTKRRMIDLCIAIGSLMRQLEEASPKPLQLDAMLAALPGVVARLDARRPSFMPLAPDLLSVPPERLFDSSAPLFLSRRNSRRNGRRNGRRVSRRNNRKSRNNRKN